MSIKTRDLQGSFRKIHVPYKNLDYVEDVRDETNGIRVDIRKKKSRTFYFFIEIYRKIECFNFQKSYRYSNK